MAAFSVDGGKRSPAPGSRTLRALASLLGGVGLVILSGVASAQDPAPAEPAPAEPAPTEPAPAEPAAAPAEAPVDATAGGEVAVEGTVGTDAVTNATGDDGEVGEVVVTVDRRRKNIQDYSGTASSLSEDQLTRVGIQNVREIASQVPGLQIGVQEGNTEVYIRGVGSDNNTELGDPAVAVHVDGIYIPRPRGTGSVFFDIARIEVNSGPQGTLRGRNALGGTVNIVTNEPVLGEFQANAEATFGNYSTRRYQGMVNIPLGDKVAFRFAAASEVHDSYWRNSGPIWDIPAAESADNYALRGTFKYQPTQRFTAIVAGDYTRERGTGWLGADFNGALTTRVDQNDPATPGDTADDAYVPFDVNGVDDPRDRYARGMNPWTDLWHYGVRGELTYDLGPLAVQALGSYRSLRYTQVTGSNNGPIYPGRDISGGNADDFDSSFWDSKSQSVIAELRAFAPDTARFRWTVGGFFFDEDQQVFLGQVADPADYFAGGEFNMPNVTGGSIAGYADGTFDIVKSFRVLGGVRVTHEDKARKGGLWSLFNNGPGGLASGPIRFGTEGFRFAGLGRSDYNASSTATFDQRVALFLDGIDSFGARDTLPQILCADPLEGTPRVERNDDGSGFHCTNGTNQATAAERPNMFQQVPQNNDVSAVFVDWRAGVEYDLADDNLLYFTVSTAHKAGGFNDTTPYDAAQQMLTGETYYNTEYDPESVLAFEVGSKNLLADKRLRANASAFYYDYKDYVFQTNVSIGVDPNPDDDQRPPTTAVRQNAADVKVLGLDLDVNYALPLGLEAGVHVLLESAKFGDNTYVIDSRIGDAAGDNYLVDIGGHWLPRASPVTLNYGLSQDIFTSIGSFDWIIQGQTRAKHYMSVYNGEGALLPPAPGATLSQRAIDFQSAPGPGEQRFTDVVPTYTRFDIGAGWKHPDGRISINGYVNNVTNIAYTTSTIVTPGLNLRFYNPPRTAGVRFRVDW
jgi:iron complex outermembrane receptor protein